jgi:hypothetical protein
MTREEIENNFNDFFKNNKAIPNLTVEELKDKGLEILAFNQQAEFFQHFSSIIPVN